MQKDDSNYQENKLKNKMKKYKRINAMALHIKQLWMLLKYYEI
jgi:hypothetical protein